MAWVAAVPEAASGDPLGFSGQVLQEQYHSLAPSRAVMQQLHEAGTTVGRKTCVPIPLADTGGPIAHYG